MTLCPVWMAVICPEGCVNGGEGQVGGLLFPSFPLQVVPRADSYEIRTFSLIACHCTELFVLDAWDIGLSISAFLKPGADQ